MRRPDILEVFNRLSPCKKKKRMLSTLITVFYLAYLPPHRNTVQRQLKRLQFEKKFLLAKQLLKVNAVSVTCNFWSDKRLYSYICFTGHFFTSKDKFISKILSFSWFHERHTSVNISMLIKKNLRPSPPQESFFVIHGPIWPKFSDNACVVLT